MHTREADLMASGKTIKQMELEQQERRDWWVCRGLEVLAVMIAAGCVWWLLSILQAVRG